jgi:BirA family biotin operon repressor/biotin-[acetyl-CoA-carboxylase] ligase
MTSAAPSMTYAGAAERIWLEVEPLLPGFSVDVLPQVDSTNSELMRRSRLGQTDPVLLVAQQQTAGRGRLGRQWQSQAGDSLTFSLGMLLRPSDWSGLSLSVGVALADALHPEICLKWPNDLWLADRKLGGILIETAATSVIPAEEGIQGAPSPRYAVVGVGINIAPRASDGLSTRPASLRELRPATDAPAALLAVAGPLVRTLLAFESFGFAPFQARFNARDALRERPVTLSDGTTGTAHGASESGALLVHTATGMHAVTSSEVSVRPSS